MSFVEATPAVCRLESLWTGKMIDPQGCRENEPTLADFSSGILSQCESTFCIKRFCIPFPWNALQVDQHYAFL